MQVFHFLNDLFQFFFFSCQKKICFYLVGLCNLFASLSFFKLFVPGLFVFLSKNLSTIEAMFFDTYHYFKCIFSWHHMSISSLRYLLSQARSCWKQGLPDIYSWRYLLFFVKGPYSLCERSILTLWCSGYHFCTTSLN